MDSMRFSPGGAVVGFLGIALAAAAGALQATLPATLAAQTPANQSTAAASTTASAVQPLVMDPAVRTGRLANGLTYYIRANATPAHRAELRFVVNAGSVLEDENQRGLAHFLEHMAFNGTAHFPKHKLIDYLQSIGMGFGADINAETGFDQTVYQLSMPTDSAQFLATGLDVMHDWATSMTIDPSEVDRERKVIIEEWRMRRGVQARLSDRTASTTFAGAKYADRTPIGLVHVIETAPASELKRFYDEWYRPDLMAVVIVGDVDADQVEQMVKAKFSDVTNRMAHPRPRPEIQIPTITDTKYSILTDPELSGTSGSVTFRIPAQKTLTTADFRRDLTTRMAFGLLGARLSEIASKPDAPFTRATIGYGGLNRTTETFNISVQVNSAAQIAPAIQAAMAEIARVRDFGFTQSELDREKASMSHGMDDERDSERGAGGGTRGGRGGRGGNVRSSAYVNMYVNSYLSGEPVIAASVRRQLTHEILPTVTTAELSRIVTQSLSDTNRVFSAFAPSGDSAGLPTPTQLLAAYNNGLSAHTSAYVDRTVDDAPLLATLPKAGTISTEVRDRTTGVVTWTLSNGIRVLVKQTDFAPNTVSISGSRKGGTSLVPDSLLIPAATAVDVVSAGGMGPYDARALRQRLTGKMLNLGFRLTTYADGVGIGASPKNLETALQLFWLGFTQPRADTSVFQTIVQNARTRVADRANTPEAAYQDTISQTMSQHNARTPLMTETRLNEMDLDKSLGIFEQHFDTFNGYTFVIVGSMSPDQLKPLVEQYLASLPTSASVATYHDWGITPPRGVVKKTVYRGTEPKSVSTLVFTGNTEDSPQNQALLTAVKDVIQLRLLETLRQNLGGTYSPQVQAQLGDTPHPAYQFVIQFSADPARLPELQNVVLAVVDTLRMNGPTASELEKLKEESLRGWETATKDNRFWLGMIAQYAEHGWPLAGIPTANQYTQSLTAAQIQAAARQFLDTSNYMQFSLYPEKQ